MTATALFMPSLRRPSALRSIWMLGANYMWSHAINDGSLGGGEADIISPQNPFCRACDRANIAPEDIRHLFTSELVYYPSGGRRQALAIATWYPRGPVSEAGTLSGIATARSGLPVNVTFRRSTIARQMATSQFCGPICYPAFLCSQRAARRRNRGSIPRRLVFQPTEHSVTPAATSPAAQVFLSASTWAWPDSSPSLVIHLPAESRPEAFNIFNRAQLVNRPETLRFRRSSP